MARWLFELVLQLFTHKMSDEDWGDNQDGGWDDDEPKKSGGGGDDDGWGDDAGKDDGGDGWGSSKNEEEDWGGEESTDWGGGFEDAAGDEDEEMSEDVKVANIYYEAEDLRRARPADALAKFREVAALGKHHFDSLSDDTKTSVYKAMNYIVTLNFELKNYDEMIKEYQELLNFIPKVTRNEASEAVESVLGSVGCSDDVALQERVYQITSDTLTKMPDTERMVFNVNLKLCKALMGRKGYQRAMQVLESLHKMCRRPDGSDDRKNKGSELLEIYSLEVKISRELGKPVKMADVYEKTKDLTAAVKDPRTQSVIREMWGMMFGDEGQWQMAYSEFYNAFTNYQEIGNRDRAKANLKYAVVANLLSGQGNRNLFDAPEAKVYQHEDDIQAINSLKTAYDKYDVNGFLRALDEIHKSNDSFIEKHLSSMITDFQGRAIQQMVKSYRRIHLDHIANSLRVTRQETERLVVQLILDGELHGRIDQLTGVLDVSDRLGGAKRYTALDSWAQQLHALVRAQPQPSLKGAGGGGAVRLH